MTRFKASLHIKRKMTSIGYRFILKGHEILTTMKIKITFVWVMTPCIFLGRNHSLGVSRCFHPGGTCLLTHSLFARITLHPARMQSPAIRNSPPPPIRVLINAASWSHENYSKTPIHIPANVIKIIIEICGIFSGLFVCWNRMSRSSKLRTICILKNNAQYKKER